MLGGEIVAETEASSASWKERSRAYVLNAMVHWAIAFGLFALVAAVFALSGLPLAVRDAAALLFWLNALLFALALLTGVFGRGRDGLYSGERAVTLTAGAAALLTRGAVWVSQDWTAEDAGRALDRGVAGAVQTAEQRLR